MSLEYALLAASSIGMAIGLGLHFMRQKRRSDDLLAKIRAELARSEVLTLPELVTRVGLRDGFLSRGKVMSVIQPAVASGELVQEEPPGTTVANRLSVLRFRLGANPFVERTPRA